jgi:hypothetical protein
VLLVLLAQNMEQRSGAASLLMLALNARCIGMHCVPIIRKSAKQYFGSNGMQHDVPA